MSQIWSKLYQETEALKKPCRIKAVLDEREINILLGLLVDVWVEFATHKNPGKGLKVYIDQELSHDSMTKIVDSPPQNLETLEQWVNRIFKDQRFGAIINELEIYSNSISSFLANLIQPLFQESGMPALGVSWLSFMGNYGYTPFGVHRESKGEEGFLFHLGPDPKTFFIWKTKDYNRITGGKEVSPLNDELLECAESFELQPGDVFFIPFETYHIAYTGEFSASIVMDFINPPVSRFIDELGTGFIKSSPKQTYLDPFKNQLNESFEHITNRLELDYILKERIYHKLRKIQSNAGVGKASKQKLANDFDRLKSYVLIKPFKMILVDDEEEKRSTLYIRGHHQHYSVSPELKNVVKQWNEGANLSLEKAMNILSSSWQEMDVMALFVYLFSIEAIEPVANTIT